MLLSDWILSKKNEGLTLAAAKWVLTNALSIPPQQLTDICRQADHPLLQDETLFDDIPNDVRALFVSTPLLPRKYFNGAFAWLFGENSIEEIKASSFQSYENLLSQYSGYSIDHKWEEIPFTKDEYDHIYSAFYAAGYDNSGVALARCLNGLHQHQHISVDSFIRLRADGIYPRLNEHVSEEVAGVCFNHYFDEVKNKFECKDSTAKVNFFLSAISEPLKLKNLRQEIPNMAIATFGLENFKHREVFQLYNGNIPDEIMTKMIELDMISPGQSKDLILDERIPLKMALEAVKYRYDLLCSGCLKRSDVTPSMRLEILSEMRAKNYSDGMLTYSYKKTVTDLINRGILTLPEIELVECKELNFYDSNSIFRWSIVTGCPLPRELQEKWINYQGVRDKFSKEQLQVYWDLPRVVKLIIDHYINRLTVGSPLGTESESVKDTIPYLFQNKGWTGELLLELLKACNQAPAIAILKRTLNSLRTGALCKLFSESVYPALVSNGDGVGKHGRVEIPLACIPSDAPDMLSQCELDLIAQSNIQFDYKDADVDLGHAIRTHPGLNEAVIAQQLKRRLEKVGDMSTSPRKSNHI